MRQCMESPKLQLRWECGQTASACTASTLATWTQVAALSCWRATALNTSLATLRAGSQTHPDGAHQRPSTSAAPSCAGNVLLFQWRTGHGQQQTHITVIGETPWWAMAPCRAQYLGWSPVRAIVDFCHNHKKQRNCFPTSEELKGHLLIQISGITCAAWSTMIQTSLGRFDCLSTACLCWADMMRVI